MTAKFVAWPVSKRLNGPYIQASLQASLQANLDAREHSGFDGREKP